MPRQISRWTSAALLLLVVPAAADAQSATAPTSPDPPQAAQKPEERPTGLPSKITWTFNFDAGWGTFGFGNSLFTNPKEGVEEDLSDQWFEGFIKPALSGVYTFKSKSEIYGKVSGVGERTYGSAPGFTGPDVSSFQVEDLSIGWRSGGRYKTENAIDLQFGRAQYTLGKGLILWDGAAEGGTRGGYWSNARKAFELAAIGRFRPGPHKIETFYLDKDDLPEGETGTRLWGTNYEFSHGEKSTFGASYLRLFADPLVKAGRDGLNVFNLRAYTAPIPKLPGFSVDVEYVGERNGDLLNSNAWYATGALGFGKVKWTPKVYYRYAFFQGDDPDTPENEAFDPLLPGFSDWGSWWQGEIAGEYFLLNSNLISHQVRGHLTPNDKIGLGVIFWNFYVDQPRSYGPGVTENHAAVETDGYVDWKLNHNILLSFVLAFASPGKAVEQASGRTESFRYGMVYVAYSF